MRIFLKTIREQKGLSLRQLEDLSGVSKTQLNDIENEKCNPELNTMCKIAKALQIEVTELFSCD